MHMVAPFVLPTWAVVLLCAAYAANGLRTGREFGVQDAIVIFVAFCFVG